MECNWPSLLAFLACETQWRVVPGAAGLLWIGLDYASCDVAIRGMDLAAHTFDDIRAMERAALKILNGGTE